MAKKYLRVLIICLLGCCSCINGKQKQILPTSLGRDLSEKMSLTALNDQIPRIKYAEASETEEITYRQKFNLFSLKDYKFVLKGGLPEVPQYLWVYKVDYKGITLEEAKKIAKENFEMDSEAVNVADGKDYLTILFKHGDYLLRVYGKNEGSYLEGRFTYSLNDDLRRKFERKGILVTKEKARQVADEFIKSHGLWPDGQIKDAVIGEGTSTTLPENEKPITIVTSYTFYYIPSVDGYSAAGNTLDIWVEILADGIIGEVSKRWMNFKKYKKYPTKNLLEAWKDAEETKYIGYSDCLPRQLVGGEAFFRDIVYCAEDLRYEYLQPCYRFDVKKFVRETPAEPLEAYFRIPAIKDEYYARADKEIALKEKTEEAIARLQLAKTSGEVEEITKIFLEIGEPAIQPLIEDFSSQKISEIYAQNIWGILRRMGKPVLPYLLSELKDINNSYYPHYFSLFETITNTDFLAYQAKQSKDKIIVTDTFLWADKRKELTDLCQQWWDENKDYLYWNSHRTFLIINEKTKKKGIPVDPETGQMIKKVE